jgi:predicted dehydrogenase
MVSAVVDPSLRRRETIRRILDHPNVASCATLDAVPVDRCLVTIATPPSERRSLRGEWFESAAAVLVEKPLGNSLNEAREFDEKILTLGPPAFVVHNYRFEPTVAGACWATRSGELGVVREVHYRHQMTDVFWGAWPGRPSWRAETAQGCLLDLGYHAVYILEDLLGEKLQLHHATGILDTAMSWPPVVRSATMTFIGGSAVGSVELSWDSPTNSFELDVCGDRGRAHLKDGTLTIDVGGRRTTEQAIGMPASYRHMYSRLDQAIRDAPAGSSDVRTAIRIHELLDLAYAVIAEQVTEPWSPVAS